MPPSTFEDSPADAREIPVNQQADNQRVQHRVIRTAVVLAVLAISGCWRNPPPPSDGSTDAYGWKAELTTAGSESYYRVPLTDGLERWMKEQSIQSLAVFDARGVLQQCGVMTSALNAPLATAPTPIETTFAPFDPRTCSNAPRPNICFKNQPCSVPDFCPFQEVDLTGTTLEHMTSVEQIVAAGTTSLKPVICSPLSGDGYRLCDERDQAALVALQKAEATRTEAQEFMANFGLVPDADGLAALEASRREAASRREILITLNQKPVAQLELRIHWRASAATASDKATLVCFTNGSSSQYAIAIGQLNAGDAWETSEWPACGTRSYRLTMPADPNLILESVQASAFAPKPFMRASPNEYWFASAGTAPYSLYFEKGHGACQSQIAQTELSRLPRAFDAEWPPAATTNGLPIVHERSAWTQLRAARPDVAAWIYWVIYVGGACLAAFVLLLAYSLTTSERSRSRSRT